MSTSENQIVVHQPNETVRLDVLAEIIPGLLASIRKAGGVYFVSAATSIQRAWAESSRREMRRV